MAIALDATASGQASPAANPGILTISHTLGSGSNRAVVVAIGAAYNSDSTVVYGVKYNGVAMTQAVLTETTTTHRTASGIFYILEASLPVAGTYNVVITATTAGNNVISMGGEVYSLTGVKQSAQPDATNSYQDAAGGASLSKNITTVAANAWVVDALATAPSTTTGATAAGAQANAIFNRVVGSKCYMASTLGPVVSPGATATGWGSFLTSTPTAFTYAQASFAPSSATVTGTIAATLNPFTGSASGGTGPSGSSAQTLGAFTSAASGGTGPSGSSAQTLGAFTSAASGGTGPSGSAAQTLGLFTSSASGSSVTGSIADTLGAFTSAAAGAVGATGTIAVTLDPFTSASSGATGASGTMAATLDPFTSAASGGTGATGTIAATLDPFTSSAEGSTVTGTIAATLDPFLCSATGEVIIGFPACVVLSQSDPYALVLTEADPYAVATSGSDPYGVTLSSVEC